jgi:hypothetical protein
MHSGSSIRFIAIYNFLARVRDQHPEKREFLHANFLSWFEHGIKIFLYFAQNTFSPDQFDSDLPLQDLYSCSRSGSVHGM